MNNYKKLIWDYAMAGEYQKIADLFESERKKYEEVKMTDIQDYAKTITDPKKAIKLAKAEIKEWQKLITILEKK
jgi:hypothetical protein